MSASLSDAILSAGKGVTGDWKKAKKREDRVSRASLARLRWSPRSVSLKEAAFEVMEQAYNKASSDGRYYANARQIMYAARPLILSLTDKKIWKNSNYFTQTILKDYLEEYQPDWKIVWDARGHLHEPHTGHVVDLGGLKVMEYTNGWRDSFDVDPYLDASDQIQTTGPALRYGTALFIEKEGFAPILEAAGIAERYDLALVSSKGPASRRGVQALTHPSGRWREDSGDARLRPGGLQDRADPKARRAAVGQRP